MQQAKSTKAIVWWLVSGVLLIMAMVIIGGVTRLTGSGLSIVEWNVISGTLPPLNEAAWAVAFDKYKQFPEYQKLNFGMTLEGFKKIFWWEYLHRLLGRAIGLVFILPFLYFFATKQFPKWLLKRLLVVLMLGVAQGVMGWIMVKSGLSDNPHVSHYRLAAHLCLALILIGVLVWTIADMTMTRQDRTDYKLALGSKVVLAGIVIQIILGAFVAGLKSGFSYNTFPSMEGEFFPSHLQGGLTFTNFLDDGVAVQFLHRWFGVGVVLLILFLWSGSRRFALDATTRLLSRLLLLTALTQVMLGIITLLLAVPVSMGVLHQVVAVVLFGISLLLVHQLTTKHAAREV